MTDALAEVAAGADLVAGVDARGFLLGGAVAIKLGTGVLAVRKGGKLPPPVLSETYDLEYGTATLEIPADGIELAGRNVVDHRRRPGHRGHGGGHGAAADGTAARWSPVPRWCSNSPALGGRDVLKPLPVSSLHTV